MIKCCQTLAILKYASILSELTSNYIYQNKKKKHKRGGKVSQYHKSTITEMEYGLQHPTAVDI